MCYYPCYDSSLKYRAFEKRLLVKTRLFRTSMLLQIPKSTFNLTIKHFGASRFVQIGREQSRKIVVLESLLKTTMNYPRNRTMRGQTGRNAMNRYLEELMKTYMRIYTLNHTTRNKDDSKLCFLQTLFCGHEQAHNIKEFK